MQRFLRYVVVVLAAVAGMPLRGAVQEVPEIIVSLRPDSIMIGDHVTLRVEVRKDMMQLVDFPTFEPMKLDDSVVFIGESAIDTLESEGRRQAFVKEYTLTSFRAGRHDMGKVPVMYVDKNVIDTLYSEQDLSLLVNTFEIDTAKTTIYDIKPPEGAPLKAGEVGGYVAAGVLIVGLLALVAWLLVRRAARRKAVQAPQERIPPHLRAIRDLEELHSRKLWQNNSHKAYYTRLTDIIRYYIEGRYGLGAMEMTSGEILSALSGEELTKKSRSDLEDMLRTADLVKFAKFVPDADYNEAVYYNAYYFVEDTKELPEEIRQDSEPEIEG